MPLKNLNNSDLGMGIPGLNVGDFELWKSEGRGAECSGGDLYDLFNTSCKFDIINVQLKTSVSNENETISGDYKLSFSFMQ